MNEVIFIKNPCDINSASKHIENDVRDFYLKLLNEYPSAKIYHHDFAIENNVTDICINQPVKFYEMTGRFIIVCHAEWEYVIAAVVALVVGVAVALLMPVPSISTDNVATGSTNNSFSDRVNKANINGAMPDVYGTVNCVPNLLVQPYMYFKDGIEVEELVMCASVGYLHIPDATFKDGDTPFSQIAGAQWEQFNPDIPIDSGTIFNYAPFAGRKSNSINGQTLLNPNLEKSHSKGIYFEYPNIIRVISNTIEDINIIGGIVPEYTYVDFTKRFNSGENIIIDNANYGVADELLSGSAKLSVAGVLIITSAKSIVEPDNFKSIYLNSALFNDVTNGLLDFSAQYKIESIAKSINPENSSLYDYTITLDQPELINGNFDLISAELTAQVSATLTNNVGGMSLDGEYVIETVSQYEITLATPSSVNDEWEKLALAENQSTQGTYPVISLSGSQNNWIGWFISDTPKSTMFSANIVAQNGIYQGKTAKKVDIEIEIQQVNAAGMPIGTISTYTGTMWGKSNNRDMVGLTIKHDLGFTGPFRFRLKRTNSNGVAQDLVDEVKIRDFYAGRLGQTVYHDMTVIRTVMQATEKALGVKERRVNCIATRKLYSYRNGVQSTEMETTNVAANTIAHLALDSKIGRLSDDYIDIAAIYDTFDEIIAYFQNEEPAWFCYTFDDLNMSAKEKLAIVGEAVFSTLYHQGGSKLYMQFERIVDMPKLLFNHRNKDPDNPEVWTRAGGIENDYDGVEIEYINPDDDTKATIVLPSDVITNPKKITLTGVRSHLQAEIHAHRTWNRLQYQRIGVKFNTYAEGDLIVRRDPILIAKNINCRYLDGEVMQQNGLVLTLSQSFQIMDGETAFIHLQMPDATVDVIELTGNGDTDEQVILSRASIQPLKTGQVMNNTAYMITSSGKSRQSLFIVNTKSNAGVQRSEIEAINYDARYYDGDHLHLT